jgi:hypothetical protein
MEIGTRKQRNSKATQRFRVHDFEKNKELQTKHIYKFQLTEKGQTTLEPSEENK